MGILTNQPTTKELRSKPTSVGLSSHSCVWPHRWA